MLTEGQLSRLQAVTVLRTGHVARSRLRNTNIPEASTSLQSRIT